MFTELNIDTYKLTHTYKENPTKEDVEYLFLELNLTREEVGEILNMSLWHVREILRRYSICKSKHMQTEAAKRRNLQKYGVSCSLCRKDIQEQIKQTNLQKYGCRNVFENKDVQEQIKQTNLQKYGCRNVFENKDVQEQVKETNKKKYGAENAMKCKSVQEKVNRTNYEKYGSEHLMKIEELKEKAKQTNLQKYGCACSLQNKKVQEKAQKTLLHKYGVKSIAQKDVPTKTLRILGSRSTLEEFISSQEDKTISSMSKVLGFCDTGLHFYFHKYNIWHLVDSKGCTSSYEKNINSLFNNSFSKTRSVIPPYEIDLYNEDLKFGIEFNGNYWHCELQQKDTKYHQIKSLMAENKGVFIYHIFEHEWLDDNKRNIILSQLENLLHKNPRRVFARKCDIREVPSKDSQAFLEENHLQGACGSTLNLGLYYQGELVSLMTFGKPRFNKNCEWELIRFCNKLNTSVVGGASKLFKNFLRTKEPKFILSYSHIDKGQGTLYEKLGFSQKQITSPGYVWIHISSHGVLSRYQCQKHKLLKQGFEGRTEKEIMEKRGYSRLFDCGNKVWEWIN